MEIKGRLGLLMGTVGKAAKAVRGRRLAPHENSKRNPEQGNLATSGLTTETGDPANPAATATALLHETGLAAWPAGMRYALALAGTFAVVAGLWIIAPVFTPAFLALCMALTLHPVSQWLIRRKVPAALAALLNIVLMFAVMLGVTGMIAGALTAVTTELPRYQRKFQILYQDSIHLLERLGDRFNIDMSSVTSPAQRVDLGRVTSYAGSLANSLGSAGTTMFYFTMLAIFLVGDLVVMRRRAAELATYAPGLAISLRKFARGARMYFLMATFFGAGVAVLDIIIMYIFEVPSPWTWGILAFVANYIPAVGFIISMIPPVLMVLVTQGVGPAIGVAVSFIAISTVVFNFVQPRFAGSAVGLNPTIAFLSLMVWSAVLGPLGAVVSVPMTLFIKAIFVDSDPRTVWIDVFLRPSDTPPADLLRRKRDRDRDGRDDRTGEAVLVDRRTHEEQVREAAEAERQRAQATIHELNEAAQAEINQAASPDT
ncbi:AI-2E family transporter [Mobiluncus mulieris]|uniref:AI-2E family transporter n=1 Tax=Mobiluncus mulieris TaxID=2052 RepID=UPI000E0FA045|nr:AI-2E family transporter [Mobiluncus mulieris]